MFLLDLSCGYLDIYCALFISILICCAIQVEHIAHKYCRWVLSGLSFLKSLEYINLSETEGKIYIDFSYVINYLIYSKIQKINDQLFCKTSWQLTNKTSLTTMKVQCWWPHELSHSYKSTTILIFLLLLYIYFYFPALV